MRAIARISVVLTVVAFTLGIGVLVAPAAEGQSAAPYVSPTGGFAITFPGGWEQRPVSGGGILGMSPQESPADTFRENVNVVYETLPTPMTSQQYAAANIRNMSGSLQQFRVVEQGQGLLGGRQVTWGVYQHDMGRPLMVLAYFVTAGGRGYVVTCTGNPTDFVRWRPLFAQVAATFRV